MKKTLVFTASLTALFLNATFASHLSQEENTNDCPQKRLKTEEEAFTSFEPESLRTGPEHDIETAILRGEFPDLQHRSAAYQERYGHRE